MLEKLEHEGPVEVVDEKELKRLTKYGWLLLATYEIEIPSWDYRTDDNYGRSVHGIPKLQIDGRNGYGDERHKDHEQDHFNIRQRRFVMGQPKDKYFAQLRERVDAADMKVQSANKTRQEATKQLQAEKENLDRCAAAHSELQKRLSAHEASYEAATDALEKIETDMAEVRNAIGERTWTEILSKEKTP